METFNFNNGNILYNVTLKTKAPLSVEVKHYNKQYVIEQNFFGEWLDKSNQETLDQPSIEAIGKLVEERIRVK